MPNLNSAQTDQIVGLIEPFVQTVGERQALVEPLVANASGVLDLDYSGGTFVFARRLIYRLRDYGEIEAGTPGLWTLLEAIRANVGLDKQEQIDGLKAAIFADSVPTAEYVIVSEGGKYIFLSYSHHDGAFVKRLRADLLAAGINIWIDQLGLKIGDGDWEQVIRDAIQRSDGVLLVATPRSRESPSVRGELAVARARGKILYPVWADGDVLIDSISMDYYTIQNVDMRGDQYAQGLPALLAVLRAEAASASALVAEPLLPPPAPDFVPRNPYKGLSAFRAEDRADFFGRGELVKELLDLLRADPHFLALIGASGGGKSSIMMAGLLPRLRDGKDLPGSDQWVYLRPFVPGKAPLEHLTEVLGDYLPQLPPGDIRRELEYSLGLMRLARRITGRRLVIYIDQFEELFTLTEDEQERRQFINLITTAATESESGVTVLLTLRADFYDRLLQYPELGALMQTHARTLLPLALADLFDVILKPAAQDDVRLSFEPGLVEEMAYSVLNQAGALPLLEFTLDLLFDHRDGLRLTGEAYRKIGGVRGALAQHAETTYSETLTDDAQRALARALFQRLFKLGTSEQDTTRRRIRMSDLTLSDAAASARFRFVAETFVKARLLTTDTVAGGKTVETAETAETIETVETIEVSHEALVREWTRLAGWLRDARKDVEFGQDLSGDAAKWQRSGRRVDDLYRGQQLVDALDWTKRNLANAEEQKFIDASAAEEKRRSDHDQMIARRVQNFQLVTLVLAFFVVVALIVVVFTANQASAALNSQATAFAAVDEAHTQVAAAGQAQQVAVMRESSANTQVAHLNVAATVAVATSIAVQVDNIYSQGYGLFLVGQYPAAQIYFEQAIQASSSPPAVYYYALARTCQQQGDYSCAVTNFNASLQVDPNYTLSLLNLAMVQREQGHFDDAEATLQRARAANQHNGAADPLGSTADYRFAIVEGSLQVAQEEWQRAINTLLPYTSDQYSAREEVYYYLAASYHALGDSANACHFLSLYFPEPAFPNAFMLDQRYAAAQQLQQQLQCPPAATSTPTP